ncbi:hypothetical protein ABIA68_001605 [Stenotrophomonas rhizophila]|uniref:hypothetical protein n=1 Tax=Stenotrophomonas rhizophila TaxID=216778 RepID=UPI0033910821
MPAEAAGAIADGTFAAVVGGIAGGVVAGIFNYFAAKRTRVDLKFDALENSLSFFQDAAVAYWRSQGQNDSAERNIITLTEALEFRIRALSKHGFKVAKVQEAQNLATELWEVTTGGTFQTKNRVHDHRKIERIRELCTQIIDVVR